MANYDIPLYPTRRLRYYNNQFLKDQDFIDAQAHPLSMAQAHFRSLYVAGVCEGLILSLKDDKPFVTKGLAIDSAGHMIALNEGTPGPGTSTLADGQYLLHITFHEDEKEMAPQVQGGAQGNTRWTQQPVLGATQKDTAVPPAAVVLGTFTVVQAKATASSTARRQYSGIRIPGPSAGAAATITNRNDGSADGALLGGDLTIRRDVPGGKIGPILTLMNGVSYPEGANSGAAIDFDGYDPGGNAPALRLQAVGDNAGSSHLALSTKQPGAITNNLVERLRVTSLGVLQFANDGPQDKLIIREAGPTDRCGLGLGLNAGNLSLFYPAGGRFSLRLNNSTGTEVFGVTGTGATTIGDKLEVTGQVVASSFRAKNSLALDDYRVPNTSNITLISPPGDRDTWIYRDIAKLSTNWGIYHRQVDSPVAGLPADSIAFIGGQSSKLQAYVCLVDGSGFFAGKLAVTDDIQISGKHAFRGSDTWLRLNQDNAFASGVRTAGLLLIDGNIDISGELQIYSRSALNGGSDLLTLNPAGGFASGVLTIGTLRVDGDIQIHGKGALRGSDGWLRLNHGGAFATGVYAVGSLCVEGEIQLRGKCVLKGDSSGSSPWLRLNQEGDYSTVFINSKLRIDGYVELSGKHAFRGNDNWLRLNSESAFPLGVYVVKDLHVDGHIKSFDPIFFSSVHDKTGIRELQDALATLDQLNPVLYERFGESRVGFIAEEVREVFAHGADAADDFFSIGINPNSLLALTVAAVQELSARLNGLSMVHEGEPRAIVPPGRGIEVVREGTKDGHHYITARFLAEREDGRTHRVVRTVRIPEGASRDECLEAEYEAWKRRIVR